ncbi:MAG: hypothetical protein EA356_12375 [Geminicoccaceae bacterium]|nr:MAG: hypothetical protein EA356_12375 [Geminicoccaceae bacterium]
MTKRRRAAAVVLVAAFGLAACGDAGTIDRQTGDRVLLGTGAGAATGAVVGALGSGTLWGGLAIGAAAGAAGGFVADQIEKARRE